MTGRITDMTDLVVIHILPLLSPLSKLLYAKTVINPVYPLIQSILPTESFFFVVVGLKPFRRIRAITRLWDAG